MEEGPPKALKRVGTSTARVSRPDPGILSLGDSPDKGIGQSSRRSWRIGQTRPVRVVFMSYRSTLQAEALKLVAKKLQSSLAVEGELPEDGLAAFADDGEDLMMALARRIVSGEEDGAETVDEVFAQARDAVSEAEELLVDDGWRAVPDAMKLAGFMDVFIVLQSPMDAPGHLPPPGAARAYTPLDGSPSPSAQVVG